MAQGCCKKKLGSRTYLCEILDSEKLVWERHIGQIVIVKAEKFCKEEEI